MVQKYDADKARRYIELRESGNVQAAENARLDEEANVTAHKEDDERRQLDAAEKANAAHESQMTTFNAHLGSFHSKHGKQLKEISTPGHIMDTTEKLENAEQLLCDLNNVYQQLPKGAAIPNDDRLPSKHQLLVIGDNAGKGIVVIAAKAENPQIEAQILEAKHPRAAALSRECTKCTTHYGKPIEKISAAEIDQAIEKHIINDPVSVIEDMAKSATGLQQSSDKVRGKN